MNWRLNNPINYLFLIFIGSVLISCTTSKQMVYLKDITQDSVLAEKYQNAKMEFAAKINKNDLLWISVGGQSAADLQVINSASGIPLQGGAAGISPNGGQPTGYLVESDGTIKLPYVGKVLADGLTRIELEEKLKGLFEEYTKNPVVNVRFINYKVTVIGEVSRPGTFTLPNERITILEALGMAGDLTIMGKRETIKIIREYGGKRQIGVVDLRSANLFDSPYYYLQTNDVVYVEPAPAKFFARERLPQFISLAAGSLSILAIILSLR